jgi:hypothetical protein
MRAVLHHSNSQSDVPLASYTLHRGTILDVQSTYTENCFVCSKLWFTFSWNMHPRHLRLFRPATLCLATTSARHGEGVMQTASVAFYNKGQDESEKAVIQVEEFYCVPFTSSEL